MAKRRANGEGTIYKRANGTWAAEYTDFTGKKRTLYGKTQQIVKDKLKEAIQNNDQGLVIEPKRVTVSEWVEEWLETYEKPFIRASTYMKNYSKYQLHIKPYFARVQLKNARPEMMQKFINEKLESRLDGKPGGYCTGVCSDLKGLLYGSLNKAVELGYIARNPAENVKIPYDKRKEKRILTREQQAAFEQAVRKEMEGNHNHSIFLLMLYTGLRAGEALGLQVGDIDFENKVMHIRRTVGVISKEEGGIYFYPRDPKTKAGKRTIPLADNVAALLQGQIERRNTLVDALRDRWEARGRDLSIADDGYLYITIQCHVINLNNINKKLRQIQDGIGIKPYISPHSLRHTFATRWLEAGLDVRSLAEILGHGDVKMTLNTYTHALPEQKRKNMEAIAGLFEEIKEE